MCSLDKLFENNRAWSARCIDSDANFFTSLMRQQTPKYLWIGCSDSRVPANEIVGLRPGEVFVHRNVANLVVHSDLNCLAVLHYAIEVLKVEEVMVVGHYGCGGVQAALNGSGTGLTENWLRHIEDVKSRHAVSLAAARDEEARMNLLCELNVIEQVSNVCRTSTVNAAWARGQKLQVHGLVYGLGDGLLRRVADSVSGPAEREVEYQAALQKTAANAMAEAVL